MPVPANIRLLNKARERRGFTLIELVVVIAIIAVLISALVPSVTGYISSARDTAAMANAKLAFTTASALVPIWDMAERPTYNSGGTPEEKKRTYAEKYLTLDDTNGGSRLAAAIVGEQFLTGPSDEGRVSIVFQRGQVISATFTYSEGKGGRSATYSISDGAVTAG